MVRILTGTLIEVGRRQKRAGEYDGRACQEGQTGGGLHGTGARGLALLSVEIRRRRAEYDGTGISEDGKWYEIKKAPIFRRLQNGLASVP